MRMPTFVILIFLFGVYACCKEKPELRTPKQIFLNFPFELTSRADCLLIDTFYDSLNNTYKINELQLALDSITDIRSYGLECMASTGGYASVAISVVLNGVKLGSCSLNMPGCVDENEWDTANPNTPRCSFDVYHIYLLKLYPVTGSSIDNKKPNTIDDYRVKYVIKKI